MNFEAEMGTMVVICEDHEVIDSGDGFRIGIRIGNLRRLWLNWSDLQVRQLDDLRSSPSSRAFWV